jgi:sulfopyruvate decarboxylase alpha subunit
MTTWHLDILDSLKANEVRFATWVPDRVLVPLLDGLSKDDFFTSFVASREEEAIGIAGGVALGGSRAAVLMQSSGFGNIPNALASFAAPYQLPMVMIISERGAMGEFNSVQVAITRTIRPTLDRLGIPHATLTLRDEVRFATDRMLEQSFQTNSPVALILSPMLAREPEN